MWYTPSYWWHRFPCLGNLCDAWDKSEKSQKSSEAVVASENKKIKTVEKSDKPGSIPVTNISNKSTQIEKIWNKYSQRQHRCLWFV